MFFSIRVIRGVLTNILQTRDLVRGKEIREGLVESLGSDTTRVEVTMNPEGSV